MDKVKLKRLLILQEGYKQFAYDDATGHSIHGIGKVSIGYGRNVEEKGISIIEADMMLENDINYFMMVLSSKIPFFHSLDSVRQAVLVDMAFNLGVNGLLVFRKMLDLLKDNKFDESSIEMLNSDAARRLPRRYHDLANMMSKGEWLFV